jgi:hypothetical protein
MPSRITDDAASSTDGGTSSRSPSIDHVAGRLPAIQDAAQQLLDRLCRGRCDLRQVREDIADLAERRPQLADRLAERLGGLRRRDLGAMGERLELEDGRRDHLRQPVVDRVRETSPVAVDGPSESRGTSRTSSGRPEALGGRGLAPERHRFHRPPVLLHGHLTVPAGSARACIGAPPVATPQPRDAESARSSFISVVRGGGLNPPLRGAGLPGTRLGPRALLVRGNPWVRAAARPRSAPAPGRGRAPRCGRRGPLAVIEHDQAVGAGDPDGVGAG